MSALNPLFRNVGRAAYEIPGLQRVLGYPNGLTALTKEQSQIVDAIDSHVYNASESVLDGLEAIGTVMSVAARSEEGIEPRAVEALANLVRHLAVEMQHLQSVESNMQSLKRGFDAGHKGASK